MFIKIIVALAVTAAILLLVLFLLTLAAAKRAKQNRTKEILVLRSDKLTDEQIWESYETLVNALMQKANCNFSIAGSEFYDGGEIETPDFVMVATDDIESLFAKTVPHLAKKIRLITPSENMLEVAERLRERALAEEYECEILGGTTDEIVNQVRERN